MNCSVDNSAKSVEYNFNITIKPTDRKATKTIGRADLFAVIILLVDSNVYYFN
jgi:hypothetical protein